MGITEKRDTPKKISSAAARKEKEARSRQASTSYYIAKKEVLKKEGENYNKLIFIRAPKGGWYKGYDHTAVIFVQEYAAKVGSNARLLTDRDYNQRARYGVVSIPNMEKLKEKLSEIGVKQTYNKSGVVIFELPKKYTEEEVQKMLENQAMIYEKTEQQIVPDVVIPQLKTRLQDLTRCVFEVVRKMERTARDIYGIEMTRELGELIEEIYIVANGKKDPFDFFREVEATLDKLDGWLLLCLNLRLVLPRKVERMMEFSTSARTQVKAEEKRLSKDVKDRVKDTGTDD